MFPAFPTDGSVFVAMSFDAKFTPRWENVIAPAISRIEHQGRRLRPHRVDLSRASDAMVSEILRGIGRATLVLADISASADLDGRAVRNANVMYEVGIAHAVRQPQEVVLVRSDKGKLDFDIAGVRVHDYDPDSDQESARVWLSQLLGDSLKSVLTHRGLAVESAARRLSVPATQLLLEVSLDDGITVEHPATNTFGDVLGGMQRTQAIAQLLELGALESQITAFTQDQMNLTIDSIGQVVTYRLTTFGQALTVQIGVSMGALPLDVGPSTAQQLSSQRSQVNFEPQRNQARPS
jgi:hypothetical protein